MTGLHVRRTLLALALLVAVSPAAQAHCQVPCGIYDDEARFELMLEHVTTIEKSMSQINALSGTEKPNWNQLVRWVDNKDHHADELADIATYYFLAQRIKVPATDAGDAAKKKYATELSLLHRIVVHAMKSKQTADLAHVKALRGLIGDLHESYAGHRH